MSETENNENLKQKLHNETAMICWEELQQFYARGSVLWVASELDLIETAVKFANDDAASLKTLLDDKQIAPPETSQARRWYEAKVQLWSVVVAPFVLVQESSNKTQG